MTGLNTWLTLEGGIRLALAHCSRRLRLNSSRESLFLSLFFFWGQSSQKGRGPKVKRKLGGVTVPSNGGQVRSLAQFFSVSFFYDQVKGHCKKSSIFITNAQSRLASLFNSILGEAVM